MIMDIFRKVIEDQKVYCGKCSGELERQRSLKIFRVISGRTVKCEKWVHIYITVIIGKDEFRKMIWQHLPSWIKDSQNTATRA